MSPEYVKDRNADWFRGLLRGVFPYDATERAVAVLHVYGDFSGTKLNRIYVVACYLAMEDRWAQLDKLWAKALARAKVDHFHATDFFNCRGAFKGWEKGSLRHRQTEEEFVSIVADSPRMVGFAQAVETSSFDDEFKAILSKVKPKYRIRSLRLLAVQLCLNHLTDRVAATNPAPDERIAVFMENEQGIGEIVDYFRLAKRQRAFWTWRILSIVPGEKKELRPLQFADLFAYLCFSHLTHWISDPNVEPHGAYKRLADGKRISVRVLTAADLKKSLPTIAAFVEQYPSGIAWPPKRS